MTSYDGTTLIRGTPPSCLIFSPDNRLFCGSDLASARVLGRSGVAWAGLTSTNMSGTSGGCRGGDAFSFFFNISVSILADCSQAGQCQFCHQPNFLPVW